MTLQLKQMEVQLEEEYEDKQKALREKRELENKLSTLSDQVHGDPYSGYLLHWPKTGDSEDRTLGMGWYSAAGTISWGITPSPRPFSLGSTILLHPGEHPCSFWRV